MLDTLAVIDVDLDVTPLGTRSRAEALLGSASVLRRTVERILQARQLDGCVLLVPREQASRCQALVEGLRVVVQPVNAPPPAWRTLVRTARKWSLDGWRGGIGGTTSLEEYFHPEVVEAMLQVHPARRVMVFPPTAPLIDAATIDAMIDHHRTSEDASRMTFAQAPPGTTGTIYEADLVRELASKHIPAGWVLSYKPDAPRRDLALMSCCYDVRAPLRHGASRLIADTATAWAAVQRLWNTDATSSAETLGRRLLEDEAAFVPPLPREVELELTTDDPWPEAVLRPRGAFVGKRGPIPLHVVERIASELGHMDDALVVLGGFGEPLRHPLFPEVLRILRDHGIYGVAVRTSGVDLDDAAIDALMAHDVDVLSILIDGWTAPTYAAMCAASDPAQADLDTVRRRVDRVEECKRKASRVSPIVVPEMVKAAPTLTEMPQFYDGWMRKLGTVNIVGYSHYAEQRPRLEVMSMCPPVRTPCRRIRSRCLVLADGRMTVCDQDFQGRQIAGDLTQQSLHEVWMSRVMRAVRDDHVAFQWTATPLCPRCEEWHRP